MRKYPNRREVLKRVALGGVTLATAGHATATSATTYVVRVRSPNVQRRIERAGFTVQHTLADGAVLLVVGPASKRRNLEKISGVRTVVRDFTFTFEEPEFADADESRDDEFYPLQWDKHDGTTAAASAHDQATGNGTTLAILDSGVKFDHPDLVANTDVEAGRAFREGEILSGIQPVELPVNPIDLNAGTEMVERHVAKDVYGHGTHVAGIAAASNDGTTGVVGTAPDADIVSLRVGFWEENDAGTAVLVLPFSDLLLGVDHAAGLGADGLNMSIGTIPIPPKENAGGIRGVMEPVMESARRRGTVVVVSAGNSGANLQQGGYFTLPNSLAGAMSVSATGPNDRRVFYSNYGTNEIDVGAPGGGYETEEKTNAEEGVEWPAPTNFVFNAMDPDTFLGIRSGGSDYAYLAGTSMAAPQVVGAVGLVREVAPDATATQVEQAIKQGAEAVPDESKADLGAGRLNATETLDASVIRRR